MCIRDRVSTNSIVVVVVVVVVGGVAMIAAVAIAITDHHQVSVERAWSGSKGVYLVG